MLLEIAVKSLSYHTPMCQNLKIGYVGGVVTGSMDMRKDRGVDSGVRSFQNAVNLRYA